TTPLLPGCAPASAVQRLPTQPEPLRAPILPRTQCSSVADLAQDRGRPPSRLQSLLLPANRRLRSPPLPARSISEPGRKQPPPRRSPALLLSARFYASGPPRT